MRQITVRWLSIILFICPSQGGSHDADAAGVNDAGNVNLGTIATAVVTNTGTCNCSNDTNLMSAGFLINIITIFPPSYLVLNNSQVDIDFFNNTS